ncbi:hypothetical protein A3I25_01845 [Candidatus Nomurabacteria bacterium RIFCSPLOWO2_02_FULL_42_17]|uniref:D-alanine--D-alanine ligase n=1 Tax=Candidatus Nomurabacteria bacterium RIFCSPLOWO2_02_FULL_42_17 TaxID=1801789 RepID=A0A1F6XQT9_9BACT|nr:MAG: hypothetical protein A3I25_01845 [Candidatus Nomurabacteria bacterium RIFCSPLOWO2_02_FULL_42_17]
MIRVGVIRGGVSPEYEISLQTGGRVLQTLAEKLSSKYKPVDILIDRDGLWHVGGLPASLPRIQHGADVFFNALHGEYGEDGKLQQLLENLNIPYTGSGPLASAVGMNKSLTKEHFTRLGFKTPRHEYVFSYKNAGTDPAVDGASEPLEKYLERSAYKVFQKLPPPWVVKPVSGGSSIGISVCHNFAELVVALWKGMEIGGDVIVEEFIEGKEASVGVLENFRGKNFYALPALEIRKPSKTCFSLEMKSGGQCRYCYPGALGLAERLALQNTAARIHADLGLRHYSRADFIVHPRRGIYILEINTLPGLTNHSLVPHALAEIGCPFYEFLDHILILALEK